MRLRRGARFAPQGRLFSQRVAPTWMADRLRPTVWWQPHADSETASPILQARLAPAVQEDPDRASRFLSKMLDNVNWALTEFTRTFKAVHDTPPAVGDASVEGAVRRALAMFEATQNIFQVRGRNGAMAQRRRVPWQLMRSRVPCGSAPRRACSIWSVSALMCQRSLATSSRRAWRA